MPFTLENVRLIRILLVSLEKLEREFQTGRELTCRGVKRVFLFSPHSVKCGAHFSNSTQWDFSPQSKAAKSDLMVKLSNSGKKLACFYLIPCLY